MVRLAALHTLTVTFLPGWLAKPRSANLPELRTSLIPDRGGIEANLAALTDGEADFFLTYAHPGWCPSTSTAKAFRLPRPSGTDRLDPRRRARFCACARACTLRGPGCSTGCRARARDAPLSQLRLFSSFFGVALGRLFAEPVPAPAPRYRA
jgi:hypothetical protein